MLKFEFTYKITQEDPTTGNPMDLTPEVEIEVIRDTISHKLVIHLVYQYNKVWRYLTQYKTPG